MRWRRGRWPAVRGAVPGVDGEVGHGGRLPGGELQLTQLAPTTAIARLNKEDFKQCCEQCCGSDL